MQNNINHNARFVVFQEEETVFADMFDHILKEYVQGNGCDEFSVLLEYLKETMAANPGLELD